MKLDAQAGAGHLGRVGGANNNTDAELDAQAAVSHLSGVGGADNNMDAEQDAQAGVGHLGGVGEVNNNTNAKQDAQTSAGELGWAGAHLEPSLFLKLQWLHDGDHRAFKIPMDEKLAVVDSFTRLNFLMGMSDPACSQIEREVV